MSGDNHWLGDLAERHATVAPESAGMETRLLQEIARLQSELKVANTALQEACMWLYLIGNHPTQPKVARDALAKVEALRDGKS